MRPSSRCKNGLNRHFNSTFKRLWEEHRLRQRHRVDGRLFWAFLNHYDWQQCDEMRYAWNTLQECETCAHLSVVLNLTLDTENIDGTELDSYAYVTYETKIERDAYRVCNWTGWQVERTFDSRSDW